MSDTPFHANIFVVYDSPFDRNNRICCHLNEKQNNQIFGKDEIERKTKTEKLQLLWILAKWNRLFVNNFKAALAELMSHRVSLFKLCIGNSCKTKSMTRIWGETVLLCKFPIRSYLIEIQHLTNLLFYSLTIKYASKFYKFSIHN